MLIRVDDPVSWPADLLSLIRDYDQQTPTDECLSDLELPEGADSAVLGALAGHRLRCYHFTRLLPHEADAIRRTGLRVHSAELFDERIDVAFGEGYMTHPEHQELKAGHIPATEGKRRGDRTFVCLTTGREDFRKSSVSPLLENWGGEGIYCAAALQHRQDLRTMGRPTIIHVDLPMESSRKDRFNPAPGRLFLGAYRGLEDVWADLLTRYAVPASAIADIAFPGDPAYDRHGDLPKL